MIFRSIVKLTKAFIIFSLISLPAFAAESVLCQKGSARQLSFANTIHHRPATEFTVVTWNAHKLEDQNFIPDLISISRQADVLLIQEAMHETDLQNTFTSQFDFSFSFNMSFCDNKNAATGVLNASRYLLEFNQTLVSPKNEPVTNTPKVSGYSSVLVPEIGRIHIINTHGLNFNMGSDFKKQIDHITSFIQKLSGPVIWAGDFNTWSSDRMNYLNQKTTSVSLKHLQPKNDNRGQKLDHIFVRGLKFIEAEVMNDYKSSDHLPVKATFSKSN